MKFKNRAVGFFLLLVMTVSLLSACASTDYSKGTNIIEAKSLTSLLTDTKTIVVDARDAEAYAKGHLAGAVSLTPGELTVGTPVPGLIAPKETVASVLSSKGISNDSKVYIYDNNDGVNASRVWWVMKIYGHASVAVIDDGEDAIVAGGFQLSAEPVQPAATQYVAKDGDPALIATMDEVKAVVDGTNKACIIDARSQAEYDEGAIPGAILYPHTKNLFEDGTFRPSSHILMNYGDLGLKKDEPVIVYCKTSFRAAQTALLLIEAGFTDVKVYDGAWVEWSQSGAPQEEVKPEVTPTTTDAS